MSLLNFFKPKWQHQDPQVRLAAVLRMDRHEQEILTQVICHDSDSTVRKAALALFDDYHHLVDLLQKDEGSAVCLEIEARVAELQVAALLSTPEVALKKEILADISNEELLARVVLEEKEVKIRLLAIEQMVDQTILGQLVEKNCGKEQGLAAIKKIDKPTILQRAGKHASSRVVRSLAVQMWQEIEKTDNPLPQHEVNIENAKKLISKVKELREREIDESWPQLTVLEEAWNALEDKSDAQIQQFDKVREELIAAHHDFKDRQNGVIFETQKRIEQRLRLEEICEEIQRIWEKPWQIEELKKLKSEWESTAKDTGYISEVIKKRYQQRLTVFNSRSSIFKAESVQGEEFSVSCEYLRRESKDGKLGPAHKQIIELSEKVSKWQPRYVKKEELESCLQDTISFIEQTSEKLANEKAELLNSNMAGRQEIIKQLQECIAATDLGRQKEQVEDLVLQWAKPVKLPSGSADLDDQFKQLVDKFWECFHEAGTKEDWQLWQNKNLKEELIAKVRTLASVNDLHLVFKEIKAAQTKWRQIGPVKQKESNRLWEQFNQTCEDNFERCKKFFQELDEQAQVNLEKKQALCEQAKLHEDSKEWKKSSEFLKDLQKKWNEIGKLPKGQEQVVYKEFRKSSDIFFQKRTEHYIELDQQRQEHAVTKEALIAKVDKLAAKPDLAHKSKIIALQKDWRTVGAAPKEQEDDLWQRFRASCDKYFAWLDSLRPENLKDKEKLCAELEELTTSVTPERIDEVRRGIIELQKRWKVIGPVPESEQDTIWQRFRKPSDVFFEARRLEEEEVDRLRPQNEDKKDVIISELKEHVTRNDKKSVAAIMVLQEKWNRLGPAGKDKEWVLQKDFKERCNLFFKQRRQAFEEMDKVRLHNLKLKESLCVRLEVFSGVVSDKKKGGSGNQTLTLAEQLKLAFESNFIVAGDKTKGGRHTREEVEQIKAEWEKIGPIPKEHEHFIKKRYQKAMTAFYGTSKKRVN